MKRKGKRLSEDGAVGLDALRAVLRETGGQAKVEEVYRLLNAKEAAHFLSMAESTVRNMTYLHEIPCVKIGRRGVRYQKLQLILWIKAREQPVQG
jgi:predicted DNA-binding transcriptional regulator AlpA